MEIYFKTMIQIYKIARALLLSVLHKDKSNNNHDLQLSAHL